MWSDFSFALSVAALLLSVAACFVAAGFASRVQALRDRVSDLQTSLRESPVSSLGERVTQVEDAMELLANRVKMQRVRQAATHAEGAAKKTDDLPDPYRDPDGWRNAMNARLTRGKVPGAT